MLLQATGYLSDVSVSKVDLLVVQLFRGCILLYPHNFADSDVQLAQVWQVLGWLGLLWLLLLLLLLLLWFLLSVASLALFLCGGLLLSTLFRLTTLLLLLLLFLVLLLGQLLQLSL